jgi:hypothetical protein
MGQAAAGTDRESGLTDPAGVAATVLSAIGRRLGHRETCVIVHDASDRTRYTHRRTQVPPLRPNRGICP